MFEFFIKIIFKSIGRSFYKTEIIGKENVPKKDGALLISNHNSFLDSFIVIIGQNRKVRFVIYKDVMEHPLLKAFLNKLRMIPLNPVGRKDDMVKFYKACKTEIGRGEIVCIFAEGEMPRGGFMLGFKKGFEKIANITNASIIPFNVDNALGSPFTFKVSQKELIKFKFRPKRKKITINIGELMPKTSTAFEVRQKVKELETVSFLYRLKDYHTLKFYFKKFVKDREIVKNILLMADSLKKGTENITTIATYLENEDNINANLAYTLLDKTIINLNLSDTSEQINDVLKISNADLLITTKALKKTLQLSDINITYFENIQANNKHSIKINTFTKKSIAYKTINNKLETFNFSNENILLNIISINQVLKFKENEIIYTALPQNSINYVIFKIWYPVLYGINSYCSSTINADKIVQIIHNENITGLICNCKVFNEIVETKNLDINNSLRRIFIVDGNIPVDIKKQFEDNYKVEILEGYGTDHFPLISLNTSNIKGRDIAGKPFLQKCKKDESVGRALPGATIKMLNNNSDTLNENGKLLVKGFGINNNQWRETELKGYVDNQGFVSIVD